MRSLIGANRIDTILNKIYYYSNTRRKININMNNKWSLYNSGWKPEKMNVIIVHGFNGGESNRLMVILRNGIILYIFLIIINSNITPTINYQKNTEIHEKLFNKSKLFVNLGVFIVVTIDYYNIVNK